MRGWATLKRHGRRLAKHAWWMALSLSGLLLVRSFVPLEALVGVNEVGGNFLQTFGGMYGVIVAFAIYVVWQQHNETQVAVEREAVALSELYALTGWFTAWPRRDDVRRRLRDYAKVVPSLNGAAPAAPEEDDQRLLDASLSDFLGHAPQGDEARYFDAMLARFHELKEAREHRVTVSRLRLPDGLKWFVFLGGAMSVGTLWLLRVERAAVHALLTAGMTWVVVAAASLILDLDDPYGGDFVIDWGRFAEAAAQMERLVCPANGKAPGAP